MSTPRPTLTIVKAARRVTSKLESGAPRRVTFGVAGLFGWAVLAAILPHGLPLGVVGLGVVTGALASFTALGLVLVYRSCRIVNFAQAEIGGVAAGVSVLLVTNRGFSYWVAVPIGMGIALLSGALIEVTVVRRFFQAPRLILTVATIGVSQILAGVVLFLPSLLPRQGSTGQILTGFSTPFSFRYEIFPVTFNGNHFVAVLAVLGVLVGLVWLFNRTDTGIGVRGAADSQERALLLGIPVRRLSLITWVVAAGLSGLSGILAAGVLGSNSATLGTGAAVLLAPLAAAVIARFESLPIAFAASIGIGVFSQGVFWSYPRSTTVDLALFGLILAGLLLQRRKAIRVSGEELGSAVAAREAKVVPHVLRTLPEVRITRIAGVALVVAVAIGLPSISSESTTVLLGFIAIYAIIGVSLVVLTGWAGQVSLGQFAFVGLGAATTGSLLVNTNWDFLFCLLAACVCGAGVAVLIGIPALRVPGLFLAPVTIAFAVATSSYVINPATNPTFAPIRVAPPMLFDRFDLGEPTVFYYLCLAVLVAAVLLARNFRRTRVGRAVIAARDNERFASAVSISVMRVKLIAFAFSGALAGLAGGLYVLAIRGIPFGGFSPDLSVQLFSMVVVGGLTSIVGAILGALYVYFAQYFLTGAAQLFATGAGLLVVLMIAPGGLAEVLYRARDIWLRWVLRRRALNVPGFQETDVAETHEDRPPQVAPATTASTAAHRANLLQCEDLRAGYGHLQILFGVDMAVPDNAIVGLLGTNGAGKTTTLKTIVGSVPATGGRITFDGEDITRLGPIERVRRGIVMVPAKGIFGSLTVRENLRLAGWVPRHGDDQAYLETTMPRVFKLFPVLEERLNQRASLLSGGEQQMLAIAQGLLARPRLLLIDELSLGLAPIAVAAILQVIRELNDAGLPIVVVEQSINVSTTIADTSLFMEKGQVRYSGPTSELLHQDKLVRSVFFGDQPRPVAPPQSTQARASRNGQGRISDQPVVFSAKGITKSYGAITAVADLDLDITKGQILGVIGSNGAGKTTAFDIFSGFTAPDAGTVLYNGIDVTGASPALRAALGFGRTFQDVRLLPTLTAAETIAVSLERQTEVREPIASIFYVNATARSERRVQQRVGELIDAFGLSRYRDTCVADLSTGTRRVLELACIAGHRPSLLLLDEPSSGLSQAESEEMAHILTDLAATTGATLAIIEHDVPLVAAISDELVCMNLGRIIARGEPNAVLTNPDVIRSYLGTDQAAIERSGDRSARGRARTRPLRAGS